MKPTSGRALDLVFVISAILLLAGIGWTFGVDYRREWKEHQRHYKALAEARTNNMEIRTAIRSLPLEIRQIFLEKPLHVDRCVSCHLGYDNPDMSDAEEPYRKHSAEILKRHPVRRFGCTPCHGGQGAATTYSAAAHDPIPHWDDPVLPRELLDERCGVCHSGPAPREAILLADGREMLAQKGCYGCHVTPGMDDLQKPGTSLDSVSAKVGRSWLRKWIADPTQYLEKARMPTFRLNQDQINALAEYLLTEAKHPLKRTLLWSESGGDSASGKTLFGESRCISCHAKSGKGGDVGPDLARIGDKVKPQWLFEWLLNPHYFEPETKMLRFRFSPEEASDLTAYMTEEFVEEEEEEIEAAKREDALGLSQDLAQTGFRLFSERGCIGCHDTAESTKVVHVGPDLDRIGSTPLAALSFGKHTEVLRRRESWIFFKVLQPDFSDPEAKMPDFRLDKAQAARIVVAVMSLRKPDLEIERPLQTPRKNPFMPGGQFGRLFRKYRCLTCHQVRGEGGTLSTVDLATEGSRVKEEWLFNYLKVPYAVRPLVVERMPRFRMTDEEAGVFVNYITEVFVDDTIPDLDSEGFTVEESTRGQSLFIEKGCAACHGLKGKGGYVGPDLSKVGSRLRPGWIFAWLMDPRRIKPDSMMPVYGFAKEEAQSVTAFLEQQRQSETQVSETGERP